jgi:hypothetical protein
MLGRILTATVPFAEGEISIDIDKVHETWKDYLLVYGICQSTKDGIASKGYSNPELKSKILDAQVKGQKELETTLREQYKTERIEFLKKSANDLRAALWKSVKALESEKPAEKERADRESKAQTEARAAAAERTALIEQAKANAIKLGIDVNIALQLMGVAPIEVEEAEVEVETEENED